MRYLPLCHLPSLSSSENSNEQLRPASCMLHGEKRRRAGTDFSLCHEQEAAPRCTSLSARTSALFAVPCAPSFSFALDLPGHLRSLCVFVFVSL
mmetsp:Transcript_12924/g.25279  ORF Transcript_12924/g.25279 Transcript_12924/m.25279 type:complete len:94 (-) Transcript_12924:402-683(-)